MKTSKVTIRHLNRFIPRNSGSQHNKVNLEGPDGGWIDYYAEPDSQNPCLTYNHFPVLLNPDGAPWWHGTLYLLSRLDAVRLPNSKTLECISTDLVSFKNFMDLHSIDYLSFPLRKFRRPTYQFRAHLQELINSGQISSSTASRKMSSVIGFYRWLIDQHDGVLENPPWNEGTAFLNFKDNMGMVHSKKITTTDLSVPTPSNMTEFDGFIQDGGKLRPLPKLEQERLLKALVEIGNPEMKLAFLIALTTGARIQTVFTLKLNTFLSDSNEPGSALGIKIGLGTGIDNKHQKRMCIFLPVWLQKYLVVYANSPRSKNRQERARKKKEIYQDQYLFLTQSGSPYYLAFRDLAQTQLRNPPRGGAVRQFIAAQLLPKIKQSGEPFKFSFHDLRATYGVNLLEEKINSLENGRDKLFDILMLIRDRMGHTKLATTERYLNYRRKAQIAVNMQCQFEGSLRDIIKLDSFHE